MAVFGFGNLYKAWSEKQGRKVPKTEARKVKQREKIAFLFRFQEKQKKFLSNSKNR